MGDKMKLVMLGPQGSGKGTQAKMLSKRFNIPHVSTGDIFRENIKNQTELGKEISSYVNSGKLVPSEVTNKVMKNELKKNKYENGYILDGYPRDLSQAEFLDKLDGIDYAVLVDISDNETIKRLSSRRQCTKCGKIYGAVNLEEGQKECKECGGELIQREDDKPEVIKKRLVEYHNKTQPLIDFYGEKGKLKKINGEQPIEKVNKDILAAIK